MSYKSNTRLATFIIRSLMFGLFTADSIGRSVIRLVGRLLVTPGAVTMVSALQDNSKAAFSNIDFRVRNGMLMMLLFSAVILKGVAEFCETSLGQ